MLINKGFTAGDIITIKLSNGDELITRFEEETDAHMTIDRPMVITMGPQGLGMIPWVFLSGSDSFKLSKTFIMMSAISKKDAATQYMQGTTGIAMR